MKGAASLFAFLLGCMERGEDTAIVTITDVIGSSSRSIGTHMAVSETGAYRGSFSGGCVEAAVVAEAHRILASGQPETIRFGVGSPYLDIRLPCGGGLDLLFVPSPSRAAIVQAKACLDSRRSVMVRFGNGSMMAEPATPADRTGGRLESFEVRHDPDLRIVVLGHGEEPEAMCRLSSAYGAQPLLLSPDAALVDRVADTGIPAFRLKTPSRSPHLEADEHTAIVTLFHDHDWETDLLVQALEQDAFYIGSMGSRRTHEQRLDRLRSVGVPEDDLYRIVGPVGLINATRDPDTLSLSVLSQIVDVYERRRN